MVNGNEWRGLVKVGPMVMNTAADVARCGTHTLFLFTELSHFWRVKLNVVHLHPPHSFVYYIFHQSGPGPYNRKRKIHWAFGYVFRPILESWAFGSEFGPILGSWALSFHFTHRTNNRIVNSFIPQQWRSRALLASAVSLLPQHPTHSAYSSLF